MDSFPSHLSVEVSSSLSLSVSSSSGGSHQFFGLLVFCWECSPLVLTEWCRYSVLQFGAIFRGPGDLGLGSETSGPPVSRGRKGTLNEGFPFPVPAPVTGEGDGGRFSKHFNGFRGRGELFQTAQWFLGTGGSKMNQWFFNVFQG